MQKLEELIKEYSLADIEEPIENHAPQPGENIKTDTEIGDNDTATDNSDINSESSAGTNANVTELLTRLEIPPPLPNRPPSIPIPSPPVDDPNSPRNELLNRLNTSYQLPESPTTEIIGPSEPVSIGVPLNPVDSLNLMDSLNLVASDPNSEEDTTRTDQNEFQRADTPGYTATKSFKQPSQGIETRSRAEEIQNGKFVPRIEKEVPDLINFEVEAEAWLCSIGLPITTLLEPQDDDDEVAKILKSILNIDSDPAQIQSACIKLIDEKWIPKLLEMLTPKNFYVHCLLFFLLLSHVCAKRPPLLESGVDLITSLISKIASLRWQIDLDLDTDTEDDRDDGNDCDESAHGPRHFKNYDLKISKEGLPLIRLFGLLRIALLATLGNTKSDFESVKRQVWHDIFQLDDSSIQETSPRHYAEFVNHVQHKYPGALKETKDIHDIHKLAEHFYQAPETFNDDSRDPRDPKDPSGLVNTGSVMLYIPKSITEACELYNTHVKVTPKMIQLQYEIDLDNAETNGTNTNSIKSNYLPYWESFQKSNNHISTITAIYRNTLGLHKSFVRVFVDFLMQQTKAHDSLIGIRNALSSVFMLLKWTEITHVLMFENFTALLFDCQFIITANFYCSAYSDVLGTILEPYPETGFWVHEDVRMSWMPDRAQLTLQDFNAMNLQTYTYFMGISRMIITDRMQRLIFAASLSTDPYKQLLSVYEKDLWDETLQYLKLQVPLIGKKWRYMNMELISAIYLHCSTTLDDNWMSGAPGMYKMIQDAPKQELVLRDLIEKFNDRLLVSN